MAKRLVLASHNRKKAEELRAILAPAGWELLDLSHFPGAPEPEETGETFEENASIKAEAAAAFTSLPALADDSGLAVDALGGDPGVRSARFAGEKAGDAANNALLLEKLAGVAPADRTARFVSVIALAIPGGETRLHRGETTGRILERERGKNGFGYDPLFLSADLGVTFAEAASSEKHAVSHRGRAIRKLIDDLFDATFF